jgi:RNA polymerase sigma factor (sigma-70 family)
MTTSPPDDLHQQIDAIWRREAASVIAAVNRLLRDVGLAEDMAQDALVAALEHWPLDGLPDKPGAWLMTTARHRALDHLRRDKLLAGKHEQIGHELEALQAAVVPDFVDTLDAARQDEIGDDLLRLIFSACHPVLVTDARLALTLRLLGGLSTAQIARAFLVPEPTIAQRIVRAKRSLAAARVPFELPRGAALGERLASVLEVIYLLFNEGYSATSGTDLLRPDLCDEALRLARLLVTLAPAEPEVHGLLALLELQASRAAARTDAQGRPVLLPDQRRELWDELLIRRGLNTLDQARALAARHAIDAGPYTLQAAIAACHARARRADDTDWPAIVAVYDALLQRQPSPVIALNRAVAIGMAQGPTAALSLVDQLAIDPALQAYPWLPAVRGDLLVRLGREVEARAEFTRAASLTGNERERELLLARAGAHPSAPP